MHENASNSFRRYPLSMAGEARRRSQSATWRQLSSTPQASEDRKAMVRTLLEIENLPETGRR